MIKVKVKKGRLKRESEAYVTMEESHGDMECCSF